VPALVFTDVDVVEIGERVKHMNIVENAEGRFFQYRGILYQQQGNREQAQDMFEKAVHKFEDALSSDPNNSDTIFSCAASRFKLLEMLYPPEERSRSRRTSSLGAFPRQAIEVIQTDRYFQRALDTRAPSAACMCSYAEFLIKCGRLHAAEEHFLKALELDSSYVYGFLQYGNLLKKYGDPSRQRDADALLSMAAIKRQRQRQQNATLVSALTGQGIVATTELLFGSTAYTHRSQLPPLTCSITLKEGVTYESLVLQALDGLCATVARLAAQQDEYVNTDMLRKQLGVFEVVEVERSDYSVLRSLNTTDLEAFDFLAFQQRLESTSQLALQRSSDVDDRNTEAERLTSSLEQLSGSKDATSPISQELEAELMVYIMQIGLGMQRAMSLTDLDGALKARKVRNEVSAQDWILSGVLLGIQISYLLYSCVSHSCTAESCPTLDIAEGRSESMLFGGSASSTHRSGSELSTPEAVQMLDQWITETLDQASGRRSKKYKSSSDKTFAREIFRNLIVLCLHIDHRHNVLLETLALRNYFRMIVAFLSRFSLVNKLLDKTKDQDLIVAAERVIGDLTSLLITSTQAGEACVVEEKARKGVERLVSDLEKAGVRSLIRNRKYHLRSYENCFIGKDFVKFLVEKQFAQNVIAAVDLGRKLVEYDVIHHVTDDHHFENGDNFYRYLSDEAKKSTETLSVFALIRGVSSTKLTYELAKSGYLMFKRNKNWKRMFFVARAGELCFYIANSPLDRNPTQYPLAGYHVQAAEEDLKHGSFAISLTGKSRPTLYFAVDSYEEQEDVFQALCSAGATALDESDIEENRMSFEASCVHEFFAANLDQDMVDFHRFAGSVLLVVNVASK